MALRLKGRMRLGRKGLRRGIAKLRDRAGKFAYTGGKKKFRARARFNATKRGFSTRVKKVGEAFRANKASAAGRMLLKAKGFGEAIPRAFKTITLNKNTRFGKAYRSAYGATLKAGRRLSRTKISMRTARLIQGSVVVGAGVGAAVSYQNNLNRRKRDKNGAFR